MWKPWTWSTASHERAIANARAASTQCSRRRVERTDVELYLAERAQRHAPTAVAMHPA